MKNDDQSLASQGSLSKTLVHIAAGLAGCFILVVAAYSIYVALHEPDPQETVLLGQTKFAADSPASLRVVVRNRVSGRPIRGAEVVMRLRNRAATIELGRFRTDAWGSLNDPLVIPELAPGEYELVVESKSSVGRDQVVKKVEIVHPVRVLLSSDKPVYQPGQAIHLRSLVLNGRTGRPFTNEAVTFEVSDPKGNKVFKESHRTSRFGIASADFELATEVNLGRYQIRAMAGPGSVERTVEIKSYVLPKFKVGVTSQKSYYLPGELVSGVVAADYFFGKAVHGATVKLSATTLAEQPVVHTNLVGRTDAAGKFGFQFVLPDYLVGLPQSNEQALLDLCAEVCDTAGHVETKTLSLSVARSELEVIAIPEAGELVPGVENVLYVLTAYPDGRPAPCKVIVDGTAYQGGAQGLCEVKVAPADIARAIHILAVDASGRKQRLIYHGETNRSAPAFLLRSDKALYRAGETARMSVLSAEKYNTVFIDLIKEGQTVLTKSVPLVNHKADYSLALPTSMVGALKLNAYVITEKGEDRGCSRLIYVSPASGLHIAAKSSQSNYRPGEIARLDLSVTDGAGNPAPAALGIAVVDESVFAMHENRPGLLRQFMDAEGELMKPRYQIKFFSAPARMLETGDQSWAAAYFASLEEMRQGPSLDELVQSGYVSEQVVKFAREMRGTSAYERFRSDPEYAAVMRLLEEPIGSYSLREATGPAKQRAVEAHRKAYFRKLEQYLLGGMLTLLFLSPAVLFVYASRPGAGIDVRALNASQISSYMGVASSLHQVLALLILLPLFYYPLGGFLLEWMEEPGIVLLGLETAMVCLALYLQHQRLRMPSAAGLESECAPLRVYLGAFLAQFIISRAGFLLMSFSPRQAEGLMLLWGVASLVAPMFVLGSLGSHVRNQLAAKGITAKVPRITLIEVLLVLCLLSILGAMLLPALAKSKGRAMSISLLNDLKQIEMAGQIAKADGLSPQPGGAKPLLVRRDFPETLFWRPELITDDQGKATLEIPLADSITTWRASIDAISVAGQMGNHELPIPVYQDFFVDLDLPVSLSLGDQISIPVTCYNYLKEPQDIRLTLAAGAWHACWQANQLVHLGPNEVRGVRFPIHVLQVGTHALRVTARGARIADAIERELRVVPTGIRQENTWNEVLKGSFTGTLMLPAEAIPGSASLWAKFYPSRFTEVVEGLESVFQAPYGCFEQTSSTTYPNVLVLDYLKRVGRLSPEVELKARQFINAGYQRLLTFEVPGGGFEWFGHSPANICLTAYGILEFTDMARVHPVDEAVTERARQWLRAQQHADGSWGETHRGSTWADRGSMTAFVAWALAESGDQSLSLDKALGYLREHPQELSHLYAKALAANAFVARRHHDTFGRELVKQIQEAAIPDPKGCVHWTSTGYSITYSHDTGMDTECTALCVMALMKAGTGPQTVKQGLTWISTHKGANGTLGSTQATILAMRALLEASATSLGQDFESVITLAINGKTVETCRINKENSDVLKQVELSQWLRPGVNTIEFRQAPAGELPFQLAGTYWLPAEPRGVSAIAPASPLEIDLHYDRTSLAVNDTLRCQVTVKNHADQFINMALVDLGIPPGFEVDSTAFEALRQGNQIAKFETTGNQVILYLRGLSKTTPLQLSYSLRAKYPLRVQTPRSVVYEYYQPQNRAASKVTILEALGE